MSVNIDMQKNLKSDVLADLRSIPAPKLTSTSLAQYLQHLSSSNRKMMFARPLCCYSACYTNITPYKVASFPRSVSRNTFRRPIHSADAALGSKICILSMLVVTVWEQHSVAIHRRHCVQKKFREDHKMV